MYTRSITFIRSCYAKESQCLGYACVTRSDFTTGRLADRRAALIFRHYWLRYVTINDKQRLTKRYKRLL